jgi:uncharacterized protein DUF4230
MGLLAPPGRRSLRVLPVLAGLGVLAVLAVLLVGAVVPWLNPFDEETRDRSQPVLLRSLENLSEYRAASANLQVVVDVERDGPLPAFLKGERTLMVAAGSVDAAVDFRSLERGAVRVSRDRRSVSLTLPAARLTETRLDAARTRVYDRDRGLFDRIADAVGDDPVDDQSLYVLAERKLREAAAADRALLATAQRNTRAMLEGLLRGLGFERIEITFRRAPV